MKNKKVTKILAVLLAGVMCATSLVGCGGSEGGGKTDKSTAGKKVIQVAYWRQGLGIEWLEAVEAAFEEKYPEYAVEITASAASSSVKATWEMPDIDEYDLYMGGKHYNTTYMEPLDTLLETTADGDSKPLKEKFKPGYLKFEQAQDGHYYTLTYGGGVTGLVYNQKLFKEAGLESYPRTTDELALYCDTLYSQGITPLCHFEGIGYYDYLIQLYMMQYDGADYVQNNFYSCVDEAGNSPSKEVFLKKDGRYQALKAFEKIITPEYTLLGSNTKTHTEIQTEFLKERAAMMVNGSWLMNEMGSVEDVNVEDFSEARIPVLSAITDHLSTVKNDTQLRKVITAVDQVTAGEKQLSDFASGEDYVVDGVNVSKADWDAITTARNTIPANYSEASVWVPNYADQKEGAMKFMEFMYSDEGYKIYASTLKLPMPIALSTGESPVGEDLSTFEKLQFEFIDTAGEFANEGYSSKNRIYTDGTAGIIADVKWVDKFCAQNADDRQTAEQIWTLIVKTVNDKYEGSWLKNIK